MRVLLYPGKYLFPTQITFIVFSSHNLNYLPGDDMMRWRNLHPILCGQLSRDAVCSGMLMKACRLKPLRPTEDLVEVGSIVSEILFDLRIFNHIIANKGG